MPSYRFTNNAVSTLSGALASGATSLTVASASAFPAAGDFTIIVDSEIMLVTGVTGTTFTVVRAQEGTSAASHDSGATVSHVLTADALNEFQAALAAVGTSFPASPSINDRFFRTDLQMEFVYDGARWVSAHLLTKTFTPKTLPDYTANGTLMYCPAEGGSSWWVEDVTVFSEITGTNDASNNWNLAVQSLDGAGGLVSTLHTFNTNGAVAFLDQTASINAEAGTTIRWLGLAATKVGAPGNISWLAAQVTYRVIAT